MISIVLYQPKIPPNTGNIMRLCFNTGALLHIIGPTGFPLDEKSMKRARMDYFNNIKPIIHESFESFMIENEEKNIYAVSKFGKTVYSEIIFSDDVYLLFGSETKGLPVKILNLLKNKSIKIPMMNSSRSLNLSNSVSIVVYEVWRQLKFSGAKL